MESTLAIIPKTSIIGLKMDKPKRKNKSISDIILRNIKMNAEKFNPNDIDYSEKDYTLQEKNIVALQLDLALRFGELEKNTTKQKLKSWFADLQLKKEEEWCEDITSLDLYEIAEEMGFKIA